VGLILIAPGNCHLFLWDRKIGMRDLGPVLEKSCDINNAGWVVGSMAGPNGMPQAFLRDPNGAVEFLGDLGGGSSEAQAINNYVQVVGRSLEVNVREQRSIWRVFIWDRTNGMRALEPQGRRTSGAIGISDTGQVLGYLHVFVPGRFSAARQPRYWNLADPYSTGGTPTPSRDYFDISDRGWVVGRHVFAKDGPHVVIWQDFAGLEKLFPHSLETGAFEESTLMVNDANQVIFGEEHHSRWERYSTKLFPPTQRWCLWDRRRGKVPLDRYLPRATRRFEVRDLNNDGCIVGVAHLKDGRSTLAVLLEPIPRK
jgi:hypothetical protein